jgi:DNA-binding transcriptional ArsR family regulator
MKFEQLLTPVKHTMDLEATESFTEEKGDRRMDTVGYPLEQPDLDNVEILDVLKALSDRTRLTLVANLDDGQERACGTFPVDVAPSTLSHHFRILREAGVIHQREVGRKRMTSLRREELNERFPGLLDSVLKDSGIAIEREPALHG